MNNKLLIHACCAPCLVGVYEYITLNLNEFEINSSENIDILWYNINIQPKSEYEKRKETLKEYLKTINKKTIIIDEYNLQEFCKVAVNTSEYGFIDRCEYCYKKRLEKLFLYASNNGYNSVTTTLLISPYQKHERIISICRELQNKYNIKFIYKDFREFYRKGQLRAKELGLYRQKYCGCVFSIDESNYLNKNNNH